MKKIIITTLITAIITTFSSLLVAYITAKNESNKTKLPQKSDSIQKKLTTISDTFTSINPNIWDISFGQKTFGTSWGIDKNKGIFNKVKNCVLFLDNSKYVESNTFTLEAEYMLSKDYPNIECGFILNAESDSSTNYDIINITHSSILHNKSQISEIVLNKDDYNKLKICVSNSKTSIYLNNNFVSEIKLTGTGKNLGLYSSINYKLKNEEPQIYIKNFFYSIN